MITMLVCDIVDLMALAKWGGVLMTNIKSRNQRILLAHMMANQASFMKAVSNTSIIEQNVNPIA